jgi:hypothetical protein
MQLRSSHIFRINKNLALISSLAVYHYTPIIWYQWDRVATFSECFQISLQIAL